MRARRRARRAPNEPRAGGTSLSTDRVLARLVGLHPKLIDLSLDRVQRLLARLGHPERRLGRVVHVAGTNGKGSVVAFLRAILEAHGRRVNVYTSPHLVRFNERIVIAGTEVADDHLVAVLEECERANGGDPITFFEITTAAAMLAFSRSAADVTLLETGLGGRLDATNVVERPSLAVLTPISHDHESFLGTSIEAIAAEKSAIIKRGVPAVSAAQVAAARRVMTARARAVAAPLAIEARDWATAKTDTGFVFSSPAATYDLPRPGLAGDFQIRNAGLAVACARHLLGDALSPPALGRGIGSAAWAGRLQRLEHGRLRALLPAGWELWLDGAHNPGAFAMLAREVAGWPRRPLCLVFGMLRGKDAVGALRHLAPHVDRSVAVSVPDTDSSLSAAEAAAAGRAAGLQPAPAADLGHALTMLAESEAPPARVLVCGSLYLIGAALRDNAGP